MVASEMTLRHDETAQELFEVMTQFCLATSRGRRRLGDLKEVEFLTLAILHQHGTMIVGDIQHSGRIARTDVAHHSLVGEQGAAVNQLPDQPAG